MSRSLDDVKESIVGAAVAGDEEQKSAKSAATLLVELARDKYHLGVSEAGEAFAFPKRGPKVVNTLRGGKLSLRAELSRAFFKKYGRVAPQQALSDTLVTLDGFGQEAEPQRLYQRVAEHGGDLWLDLGGASGQAIRISGGEWTIEPRPPVLFRRTPLTGALPIPERGGDLEEMWRWINVTPEDRPLVLAYLVAALWPDTAHPVLGIFGQQGSGKTTAMRVLVLLIDAGPVPYRKPPRDADSWVTAASGSWVVAIDNVSMVPEWLSDTLCRAVTGEGDVRRRLYTDGELHAFSFRRVIAMTGIDLGSLPGDLADRLLPINLDVITERERRDETGMWPAWNAAHPRVLGALLDLAAEVKRRLPHVHLERMPRMADFGKVLHAVDQVLGTRGLERYTGAQGRLAADSLTGDVFISAITSRIANEFEGTAADLIAAVTPDDEKWRRPKDWPANARVATQRLRRQAPVMRKAGWHVTEDQGQNKDGVVRWQLVAPESGCIADPPIPPSPPVRQGRDAEAGEAIGVGGSGGEEGNQVGILTRQSVADEVRQGRRMWEVAAKAGKAGKQNGEALAVRASALAPSLRSLDLEALRDRYRGAALRSPQTPDWWASTAKTEPLAVTLALELIAEDHGAQSLAGSVHAYLAAARAAVDAASA